MGTGRKKLNRCCCACQMSSNLSYNEMRIWIGALSATELEFLHELGPDAIGP